MKERLPMKKLHIAGLAGLASLGAHAQLAPPLAFQQSVDPLVVTASRGMIPATTMRDATVITRDELDAAGSLSLGEVLQRRAGIELRATGGPGQPQTLFIRGAGTAQTLVLVDGMRVGSATVGTTAIEHIPLELIERIEVVKGPLSSLYGPEAIGGVVQIFTRGKDVPHLFVAAGYGTDNDARLSAGITAADETSKLALSAGVRSVDARSATNPRNFFYNPDRDPYDNAFFNLRASHRLWQGETLALEAFTTRTRTHFDNGPTGDERNDQAISGVKFSSSTEMIEGWTSRLTIGQGRDRLAIRSDTPNSLETQQDQASWVNELVIVGGTLVAGLETLHQKVVSDDTEHPFTQTRRDTDSAFLGVNQLWAGQRVEGSARTDKDDQFGKRTTGSLSYGFDWPSVARISGTYARGFRAPTFFDIYGPTFPGYTPNPSLEPEHSKSYEFAVKADPTALAQWRITAFDHRFENLIVYSFTQATVLNVANARARGAELSLDSRMWDTRVRAALTAQRTRDEATGKRLQGRAELYGTLEAERDFGSWTAGVSVLASGDRFDSANEDPSTRLPGYGVVDARVRYAIDRRWSVQLSASNLFDRRYESAVGYDAPRRSVMLGVRFESF
jgi:vitamin B12 transporter